MRLGICKKGFVFLSILFSLIVTVAAGPQGSGQVSHIPRPEHPRPQFQRESWLNLNGEWDFAFDFNNVGVKEGWSKRPSALDKKIIVPFCPESKLSGIGYTDFIAAVWYHRGLSIPKEWSGQRIFLQLGAVDFDCRAWVNGKLVGRHYGGSSSFCFEITAALNDGNNSLVVCALDDVRSGIQPAGKQSKRRESHGVSYTRTTGIWQTVWLEARPKSFIESVHIIPDLDNERFVLTPVIENQRGNLEFRATLFSDKGKKLASVRSLSTNSAPLPLEIPNPQPWSLGHPYLYKLKFELLDGGRSVDTVNSYAGLRKFHIEGNKFYLNNKPIFLRFVLDQGFYPDGIWTAPDDKELKADIERSLAVGFNGARLHQKVFEERFHYWADKLGYLTWGEFPDWGAHSFDKLEAVINIEREWRDVVLRDRNHPSIVAWTPLNESRKSARTYEAYSRAVRSIVAVTHAVDPTRPINDASGYVHILTDIFSAHDYSQDPNVLRERYGSVSPDLKDVFIRDINLKASVSYEGQPYVVDEYGGIFWTKEYLKLRTRTDGGRKKIAHGRTPEEVEQMIKAQTDVLLANPNIAGFCYTQLTDIEQEVNGIYTYERELKFSAERLKKIFTAPTKMESSK